jgi:transcriptional antiterminator RfaH
MLQSLHQVETYCPRLRYQKITTRGKVWFVEALFPGYIFARFDLSTHQRIVKHSPHVVRILDFGHGAHLIPDWVIEEVRSEMDGQDMIEVQRGIEIGDEVELTEGAMRGLKGIVEKVLSGQDRVRIFIEFLGRQSAVEVPVDSLLADRSARGEFAWQRANR